MRKITNNINNNIYFDMNTAKYTKIENNSNV